jgi:hypothetical protein
VPILKFRLASRRKSFALFMGILFASGLGAITVAEAGPRSQIATQTTGDGKYVCSPSGFGKPSRCYVR